MESRSGDDTAHGRLFTATDAATTDVTPLVPVAASSSAWAPLRQRAFRWLWIGVLISSIGTVMQTVGAQWLLVDAPNAAALVALVQAANTLPVMLLALDEWATILIDKHIMLPMRDGTRLATDVYRLETAALAPVLVTRTPYDKEQTVVGSVGAAFDIVRSVQAEYAVVVQ